MYKFFDFLKLTFKEKKLVKSYNSDDAYTIYSSEDAIHFNYFTGTVPRMGQKTITKRTLLAYRLAMKTGKRKSNQLKVVMLGAEGAGKTSSVQSLLNHVDHSRTHH